MNTHIVSLSNSLNFKQQRSDGVFAAASILSLSGFYCILSFASFFEFTIVCLLCIVSLAVLFCLCVFSHECYTFCNTLTDGDLIGYK